jgi:hypothetical protein
VKFLQTNLIDSASLTGSTEESAYPAANVQDSILASVWRTTGVTSENLVINLGTAQSADIVFLGNHNLTSSATITLQANSSDSWGAPPFSESLTWESGVINKAFTSASYQYWRILIADATNTDGYLKLGGVGLGAAYAPPGIGTTYQVENRSTARKYTTETGQNYGSDGVFLRQVNVQIPYVTQAERVEMETCFFAKDWYKPFYVQYNETCISEGAMYATLNSPTLGFQSLDTQPIAYSSRYTLDEAR